MVSCKDGFPNGIVEQYYQNGRNKETKEYLSANQKKLRSRLDFLLVNAWDSIGNQTVKNYEGYFKGKLEEGKVKNGLHDSIWTTYNGYGERVIIEKYNQGDFLEGERYIKGKTIRYTQFEVPASPIGGLEAFYKNIARILRYPADARRGRIQGKVFVKFI